MEKIEQYLKENKTLTSRKISENAIRVRALDKNIKIVAKLTENTLDAKMISKAGTTVYEINKTDLDEDTIISKLQEMTDMFNEAKDIDTDEPEDLDRTLDDTHKKQILLDDTDEITVDEEEIVDNTDEEINEVSEISSLEELEEALVVLGNAAYNIPNKIFDDNEAENKNIAMGLIAGIFALAQDVSELIEDLEKAEEKENKAKNESVCVPAKTDFIDIATSGLGQSIYALKDFEKYAKLTEMLKDIRSELIVRG